MQEFDLVVAGAGVVGASIAWHAVQQGLRVAVVDAIGPAAAASGASDGAVSVASKKPGVLADMADTSLAYCYELAQLGGPLEHVFLPRPSYFFASDQQESRALDQLVEKLREMNGIAQVVSDKSKPNNFLLRLGQSVKRLVEIGGEGHMLGYSATHAYLQHARAECFWRTQVTSFDESDGSIVVHMGPTSLKAKNLVLALGLGTEQMLPWLPMIPRAGQLIVTDAGQGFVQSLPGAMTAASYLLSKSRDSVGDFPTPVVIDPLKTGQFLIGSSREPHNDATRTDLTILKALLARAVDCYPELKHRRVIRVFTGVRAAIEDGLPVVGKVPGYSRVWVATGFEGDGICLSALVGREMAAAIAQRSPKDEMKDLSPCRFELKRKY
jgi:glycine/D-amino acid oxidase-like deaminating enzyme